MDVFCGIDWAEDHHDIALAGRDGQLLARRRIGDDAAGLAQLVELLAAHGDSAEDPIPVAIETPRGLLTACLRATGRAVYPINPMAVARYRDRHSVAGRKSDHGDAVVLANILRTDAHAHRPLPADTELAQAIAVRAQTASCWARASTAIAWASSVSAGSGRWAWASVRRMLASTTASPWSDLRPATECRSR